MEVSANILPLMQCSSTALAVMLLFTISLPSGSSFFGTAGCSKAAGSAGDAGLVRLATLLESPSRSSFKSGYSRRRSAGLVFDSCFCKDCCAKDRSQGIAFLLSTPIRSSSRVGRDISACSRKAQGLVRDQRCAAQLLLLSTQGCMVLPGLVPTTL